MVVLDSRTHTNTRTLFFLMHFCSIHTTASPHTLYGLPLISAPLRNLTHLRVRAFYELTHVCVRPVSRVCLHVQLNTQARFPLTPGVRELCRNRPRSSRVMLP